MDKESRQQWRASDGAMGRGTMTIVLGRELHKDFLQSDLLSKVEAALGCLSDRKTNASSGSNPIFIGRTGSERNRYEDHEEAAKVVGDRPPLLLIYMCTIRLSFNEFWSSPTKVLLTCGSVCSKNRNEVVGDRPLHPGIRVTTSLPVDPKPLDSQK